MRSLWLASAATLFIAGAACAQTLQTGPAPTGAPNAAPMTNPGQSPGNTAPVTSGSATSTPSGAMSNSGGPTKNASGAPNGPMVVTPGNSPGKTEVPGSSSSMSTSGMSASSTTGMATPMHHHHYMGMGMGKSAMPAEASVGEYLHMAKGAIKHHNKMLADDALSHAETRLLDRAVPQGDIAADTDPGVSSIESARKAVMNGDMKTANMNIDMAMQQSGGMSSDSGMSSGSGMSGGAMSPAMSPPPMMHKPMAHSTTSSSNSGMAPAPGDTSDSGLPGSTNTATMSPSKPASSP